MATPSTAVKFNSTQNPGQQFASMGNTPRFPITTGLRLTSVERNLTPTNISTRTESVNWLIDRTWPSELNAHDTPQKQHRLEDQ